MSGIDQKFRFAKSLFRDSGVIRKLISRLRSDHPVWAHKLSVVKNGAPRINLAQLSDDDATATILNVATDVGVTYENLELRLGSVRKRRSIGSIELAGTDNSLTVTMLMDDEVFPLVGENHIWGNAIILQLRGKSARPGRPVELASTLFWRLCSDVEPDYACASSLDEFDKKNLLSDEKGVRAVGNDIGKYFPGIYWQNFFSVTVIQRIWGQLPRLPDCVETILRETGIGFGLGAAPSEWNSSERKACEQLLRLGLGEALFFDPELPECVGSDKLRQFICATSSQRGQ